MFLVEYYKQQKHKYDLTKEYDLLKTQMFPSFDSDTIKFVNVSSIESLIENKKIVEIERKIHELYPQNAVFDKQTGIIKRDNNEYVMILELQNHYNKIKQQIESFAKFMPINSNCCDDDHYHLNDIYIYRNATMFGGLHIVGSNGFSSGNNVFIKANNGYTPEVFMQTLIHEIFGHNLNMNYRYTLDKLCYYGQIYEEYLAIFMTIYMIQFDELIKLIQLPNTKLIYSTVAPTQDYMLNYIKNNIAGLSIISKYYDRICQMIQSLGTFTVNNLRNNGGFDYVKEQIIILNELIMKKLFFEDAYTYDLFIAC